MFGRLFDMLNDPAPDPMEGADRELALAALSLKMVII